MSYPNMLIQVHRYVWSLVFLVVSVLAAVIAFTLNPPTYPMFMLSGSLAHEPISSFVMASAAVFLAHTLPVDISAIASCVSLVGLVVFNCIDYEFWHSIFATAFFVSFMVHVASRSERAIAVVIAALIATCSVVWIGTIALGITHVMTKSERYHCVTSVCELVCLLGMWAWIATQATQTCCEQLSEARGRTGDTSLESNQTGTILFSANNQNSQTVNPIPKP